MSLVLFAFGLVTLVVLALVLINARDVALRRFVWRLALVVGVVGVLLFGARFVLIQAVRCVPDCSGVNLVGRTLRNRNFTGVNFVEAHMSRTDLRGSRLENADLSGADVAQSDLRGAQLRYAWLIGSDLSDSNLSGADLIHTALDGANLTRSDLSGVDLSASSLHGAIFNEAVLVNADLSGVFLGGSELRAADLSGANLQNARLTGAVLSQANLSGANLRGADLRGAIINLATLTGADLTGANLGGAMLIGSVLTSVELRDATLVGAVIMGADFAGADLSGANFSYVRDLDAITERDLQFDPAVAKLNTLQLAALQQPSSLDGIILDDTTLISSEMLTPLLLEPSDDRRPTVRVGILHSVSGPQSANEQAILDATLLAIDEINTAGGVRGMQIEALVEDGASDANVFAEKAEILLNVLDVDVIFGIGSTAGRDAVRPIIEQNNALLFYPVPSEGFEASRNIIYMGADAAQQVIPALDYYLAQGYTTFYLVGADLVYSRALNATIRGYLTQFEDATVIGESIVPPNEVDFGPVTAQIDYLQPGLIFSTLRAPLADLFFDQLQLAQITPATLPVVSFSLTEPEILDLGPEKLAGNFAVSTYFQTIDTITNFTFVEAYKDRYGRAAVTSVGVEGGYNAVYLWKALVEAAGSFAVDDLLAATDRIAPFDGPGGVVQLDPATNHLFKVARIGQIRADGLIDGIYSVPDPLPPDPFLRRYPWADALLKEFVPDAAEEDAAP